MLARDYHRYYPAGLGQSRCGVCGGDAMLEVHIAGLNQASGGDAVKCPFCKQMVPMDSTIRCWVKQRDGSGVRSVQRRLCTQCAQDPDAGKLAAKRAEEERKQSNALADLMSRLQRGDIDQAAYDDELAKLLA